MIILSTSMIVFLKPSLKGYFESCPIEIMILLQILSTSMIEFLKPSLKSILQIVKQDYYDCVFETLPERVFCKLSNRIIMIVFLKPPRKGILQFVKQDYYDSK